MTTLATNLLNFESLGFKAAISQDLEFCECKITFQTDKHAQLVFVSLY